MKSTLPLFLVVCMSVFCVAVVACAPAPEPEAEAEAQDPEAALEELRASYVDNYNAGDAQAVAEMYADDAVALYADGSVSEGREAIAAGITEAMASDPTLQINPADTKVLGDWAAQRGTYVVETAPEAEGAAAAEEPAATEEAAAAEETAAAEEGAAAEETAASEQAAAPGFSGHYLTLFRRVDDTWKIGAVITNYDAPPPAGSPAAAAPSEKPEEMTDSPISELIAAHEEHFNGGDVAAAAGDYTEDAVAAFGDAPAVVGRDAIQAGIAQELEADAAPQLDIHEVGVEDLGDGWYAGGGWYEMTGPDGEPVQAGQWIALVTTGEDGSLEFQWVVTNVRHDGSSM